MEKTLQQRRKTALSRGEYWPLTTEELLEAYAAGERDFRRANLKYARLTGATLRGASFHGADLTGADLDGADLSSVDFPRAKLHHADLSAARLFSADLNGADLSKAWLSGADLTGAVLRGAHLEGAVGIMSVYVPDMWMLDIDCTLYCVKQIDAPVRFLTQRQWLTRAELVTYVEAKKAEGSLGRDLYLLAIEFLTASAKRLDWQID